MGGQTKVIDGFHKVFFHPDTPIVAATQATLPTGAPQIGSALIQTSRFHHIFGHPNAIMIIVPQIDNSDGVILRGGEAGIADRGSGILRHAQALQVSDTQVALG